MASARTPARRPKPAAEPDAPKPTARRRAGAPPFWKWIGQQVFNLDPIRRDAAIEIQTRWGFHEQYNHARVIRILARENSEHLTGAKQLADDYAEQFGLQGAALAAVSGVPGRWFPVAVEMCTHAGARGAGCSREAIPGTGLCARHGGQWMTDADREALSHEIYDRMSGLTVRAVRVIEDILDHGRSEKVRLDAAVAVLDRTGMGPSQTVRVEVGEDPADVIAQRLERLAQAAGEIAAASSDPGVDPEIIDAEVVGE